MPHIQSNGGNASMTTPPLAEQPARVAAIAARCKAATEGPWQVNRPEGGRYKIVVQFPFGTVATVHALLRCGQNAHFIAHARSDIPWLLAEVERLHAAEARMIRRAAEIAEAEIHKQSSKVFMTDDTLYATMARASLARRIAAAILAQTPDGEAK